MEAATQEEAWMPRPSTTLIQSYLVIDTLGDVDPAITVVAFGVLHRNEAVDAIWAYCDEHKLDFDPRQTWLGERRYYFAVKPEAWAIKDRVKPEAARAPIKHERRRHSNQ